MYGCERWTIKKAEGQWIDVFELWCWRRLLRVPWTARRSNQFILKEISPGCSLEGLMLKLKLQYLGHLMWRTDSLEQILTLGKIEGRRRRGCRGWDGWVVSLTQWIWVWAHSGSWWWTGKPGMLYAMGSESRTQLRDWTAIGDITKRTLSCIILQRHKVPLFLKQPLQFRKPVKYPNEERSSKNSTKVLSTVYVRILFWNLCLHIQKLSLSFCFELLHLSVCLSVCLSIYILTYLSYLPMMR